MELGRRGGNNSKSNLWVAINFQGLMFVHLDGEIHFLMWILSISISEQNLNVN